MGAKLYRKKPVVVEAYQWHEVSEFDENVERDVGYYRHPDIDGQNDCRYCSGIMHNHGWIDTLEGGHIVCPGDFVITGVRGEKYPCKPDIFAQTYELEESEDTSSPITSTPVTPQLKNSELRRTILEKLIKFEQHREKTGIYKDWTLAKEIVVLLTSAQTNLLTHLESRLKDLKPDTNLLGCAKHWSDDSSGTCTCDENIRTYKSAHSKAVDQIHTTITEMKGQL